MLASHTVISDNTHITEQRKGYDMALFEVWIITGDQNFAGTDSNVFIQLAGTNGQTESIHLPSQDIFAFESGSMDKFMLDVPDIGNLTTCCLGHDNSEGDSGWYVKAARIRSTDNGREWLFEFEQWLGLEESGNLSACITL